MSFWFDPMVQTAGMPGYGGGGPAMSAGDINAGIWGNYSPAAAQSTLSNIYGAGGFGAQPAYYAALGAAYGRATGGFVPGGYSSGRVTRGPDLPQPDLGGYDPLGGGDSRGTPIYDPWTGAISGYSGGGIGSDEAASAAARTAAYTQQYRMPASNPSYFNPATYAGSRGNYGIPYNGRSQPGDIGFSAQPKTPNLGYNPGMSNWFANPGMSGGAFQSRFGMGFPNAGTPSQYAPGAQMPPGFLGTYSVDNPGGALPGGGGGQYINSQSPFGF